MKKLLIASAAGAAILVGTMCSAIEYAKMRKRFSYAYTRSMDWSSSHWYIIDRYRNEVAVCDDPFATTITEIWQLKDSNSNLFAKENIAYKLAPQANRENTEFVERSTRLKNNYILHTRLNGLEQSVVTFIKRIF